MNLILHFDKLNISSLALGGTGTVPLTISNLQMGEAIVKNNEYDLLGMGKRYKKIKVAKMI